MGTNSWGLQSEAENGEWSQWRCKGGKMDRQQPCVWREGAVREALPSTDATEFLKITIPLVECSDILRWPHTRDGIASVRSTYHSLRCSWTESNAGIQQHAASLSSLWLAIWTVKVWPKVQTYMWRFVSNSIAVRSNLSEEAYKHHWCAQLVMR